MVASTSAAAQASENEKRRKQALEKVKANHLSRQLQMRLQYARLKVEHGWQKQSLNEVENLYFHNSHLRTSKPFTQALPAVVTTQPRQTSAFAVQSSAPAQSSLSFKLGTSTLVRNSLSSNTNLHSGHESTDNSSEQSSSHHGSQVTATPVVHSTSTPSYIVPSISRAPEAPAPMAVDSRPTASSSLTAASPTRGPQITSTQDATQPSMQTNSIDVTKSSSTPQTSQPSVDNGIPVTAAAAVSAPETTATMSVSVTNHYPAVKQPRPRAQKGTVGARTQSSLTARDMYNFGTTSALTYDSFWSSHSGPSAVRPPRGSFGTGVAEVTQTSQIPGDFTSGIADSARSAGPPATSSALSSNLKPIPYAPSAPPPTMTTTPTLNPSRNHNNITS